MLCIHTFYITYIISYIVHVIYIYYIANERLNASIFVRGGREHLICNGFKKLLTPLRPEDRDLSKY